MSEVVQLFGARAGAYASFRPHYPDALFDWLADRAPHRRYALDIACGNGQASRPLAKRFERVLGCDASVEQLQAADVDGVALFAADAARQPLADGSLDLIVVAQALHWFATPAFFAETRRLLGSGGLFAAWCYGLMRIDARTDALVDHLYHVTLDGCWPEGRASIEAGYRDLQPPFPRLGAGVQHAGALEPGAVGRLPAHLVGGSTLGAPARARPDHRPDAGAASGVG